MASETLDGNKQKDIANVEHKDEVKEEEKAEEEREKEEEERVGDTEMAQEEEATEEKGEESKDEAEEERKKAKRGRKVSAKKKVSKDEKRDEPSSKEAVTPTSERPAREKKIVERYSEPSPGRSARKGLTIEKGRGTQLKDIPNVAFKMAKRKPDDNLQILHTILYGKKSKTHSLKRNIGQFSGYVWIENEDKRRAKIKEKLDKCVKEKLVDFCHVFDISVNKTIVRKEELSAKLLEFLESPHATTDTLLSDKEQKGKKRKWKTTASSGEASQEVSVKKRKKTPQTDEKCKRSPKTEEDVVDDKAEPSDRKNESEDDNDNENNNDSIPKEESDCEGSKSEEEKEEIDEEPMEDTPVEKKSSNMNLKDSGLKASEKSKSVKKEGTPAKSAKTPTKSPKRSSISSSKKVATDGTSGSMPKAKVSASKKQKVEKESEKDQSAAVKEKGKNKKQSSKSISSVSIKEKEKGKASNMTKPIPTKEEIHAVVVDILKKVDLNIATLGDILRQLGTHFDVDLKDRELEVKGIITDVIKNMPDDEDEGDGTESGDDAEKD